jgi:glyoxylase-like metal-dependent hydrolase (beta-lactamase superfamily II)
MIDLRVLVQGSARMDGDDWIAYPTTIFIQDRAKRIIVDPGSHPGLQEILEMNSIWAEDIDHVFLTHTHIDHTMSMGLFPDASIIDGEYLYKGTRIMKHDGRIPGTKIEILLTPGHTPDHSSLLFEVKGRKTAVCGDLFWWVEGEDRRYDYSSLLFHDDQFCTDRDSLITSRRMVLRKAEVFIPGHGEMFRLKS